MKHIFRIWFIALCYIPVFAFAQSKNATTVKGKVIDAATLKALSGATVYFPDFKRGAVADESGSFSISGVPVGDYIIEISYYGYKTLVEKINTATYQEKSFSLVTSIVEQEKVVVTGVSSAMSAKKAPIAVQLINKRELLGSSGTNLIDVISKVPGLQQISSGPAVSKPVIRGLGFNRVVVVNDGIRQEGQQWGEEHGIEIDEFSVSKIEVLKGPASLMYGSDALAGVINIISLSPVPEGTIRGNVLGSFNTNNLQRGGHVNIGGNSNGFVWGGYASLKAAADYRNRYDGRVFNSKFNEQNFGGYIGLHKNWGSSQLNITHFDQTIGMVSGERDSATGKLIMYVPHGDHTHEEFPTEKDHNSTQPFIPRQRIQHLKVGLENSFHLGANRLSLNLGYQKNHRKELGNVLNPGETEMGFDLQTFNYNLAYHINTLKDWKTNVGVNGMWQSNTNTGHEMMIPDYDLFDAGVFIVTQKTMNKVTLSGGIRYDIRKINAKASEEEHHDEEEEHDHDLQFEAFKRDFNNISGSVGFSYAFHPKWNLKLNVAKGFRAPSLAELASNGAHHGTNRFEYGNAQLKSESSFQIDGGVGFDNDHISIEASLFYNYVKNYIYYQRLQSVNGGDSVIVADNDHEDHDGHSHGHAHGDLYAFEFDQANAFLVGGEIKFDIHPHPLHWLHIENTFSYVRGMLTERRDGSRNLPFIPGPRLINEVRATLIEKSKNISNLYVKVQLDNTFKQNHAFTGYNTETVTPAYSLFNIGIGTDVTWKGKTRFSIYLAGNNLTDVAYQSHLSRLKYTDVNNTTGRMGVFNMGRNFNVKVNVPLQF
jgi:iron complex outermembrane receptor protein